MKLMKNEKFCFFKKGKKCLECLDKCLKEWNLWLVIVGVDGILEELVDNFVFGFYVIVEVL